MAAGWERGGVLLSRVAVRCVQRQCVEIPSLSSQDKLKVERIFAGHYPCEERDGYVWVYMNARGSKLPDTIPAAPGLTVFSEKYKITHLSCELPSHIDHGLSD